MPPRDLAENWERKKVRWIDGDREGEEKLNLKRWRECCRSRDEEEVEEGRGRRRVEGEKETAGRAVGKK